MHEIICPHCDKAFKIDEAGYADIQKQVRDNEVEKERDALTNELVQTKRDKQAASELADAKLAKELQETAATKDKEIQNLKAKLDDAIERLWDMKARLSTKMVGETLEQHCDTESRDSAIQVNQLRAFGAGRIEAAPVIEAL